MTSTPQELRERATSCRVRAQDASPARAQQLRECARIFLQQARRLALFEHSKEIGRMNVTTASFREYLRTQRH
ncbi:hypothetical protein [Amycolatopsis sp. NBC_01480]|uniref:hypothetical protein n=1 Tax=Amycolatopsis sp. NBC_01480 TaxID=2903562 RepID=UPI002E2B6702|nr:hypothetical protein [Amycolatopsis sp. NBC_01480]